MFMKSAIDMSRPQMLYGSGLAFLMLLSLAVSNLPQLAFTSYYELAFRKEICAGLFGAGALFGALALNRNIARTKEPWRVPQSQVAIPYVLFFLTTLLAVAISR